MVPEREHVGAGGEQPVGEPRRDPGAVGHVLAVHDAEVDVELLAQPGQPLLYRPTAGRPEDVPYEEEVQGTDSEAAGCAWIATWFPASGV